MSKGLLMLRLYAGRVVHNPQGLTQAIDALTDVIPRRLRQLMGKYSME